MKCVFVLRFYNAYTEDFTMRHNVGFSQIGSHMWKFLSKVFFEVFTVTDFPQSFIRKSPRQTIPLYGIALLLCPPVVGFIWPLCMLHVVNQTCCGLACYWLLPLCGRPSHIFSWYVCTLTVDPCSYVVYTLKNKHI